MLWQLAYMFEIIEWDRQIRCTRGEKCKYRAIIYVYQHIEQAKSIDREKKL